MLIARPGRLTATHSKMRVLVLATLAAVTLTGGTHAVRADTGRYVPAPLPADSGTLFRLTDPVADPNQQGITWFAATGHTLRGLFLEYWQRYGGVSQFGYPITEEFTAPDKLGFVQYFERSLFEYHPENKNSLYEVEFAPLGDLSHEPDPPSTPLSSPAIYFTETGHNLAEPFKSYWLTHGGLFVHGFPISEQITERSSVDGKDYLVQYFERSRFEYHPENIGTQYEVLLGLLGLARVKQLKYTEGVVPTQSHTVDLSWVAGIMEATPPYMSPCQTVPPVLDSDYRVTPIGPVQEAAKKSGVLYPGAHVILFGRLARPEEAPPILCGYDAPPYYVEHIQPNPDGYNAVLTHPAPLIP
jgi:hypothetical protein